MSRIEKLVRSIKNNPRDFRFSDAAKIARHFGVLEVPGGRHPHLFKKPGFPIVLNFQADRNGKIKPYQAWQLLSAIKFIERITTPDDE